MDKQFTFRVFLASPSDVSAERLAVPGIIQRINGILSQAKMNTHVELLLWEDTPPGAGRPQDLINAYVDRADLFIGCVGTTMGSPSGDGDKTGFEEEFYRSIERRSRSKDGCPEIWLFFKEIQLVMRQPPDENLQKVLRFRSQEEKEKRLKFKEFKDPDQWSKLIFDSLCAHVIGWAKVETKGEDQSQGTGSPPSQAQAGGAADQSPQSEPMRDEAYTSLTELLRGATSKVREGKLLSFGRSDILNAPACARLLVFAAANYDWSTQHIQFASHEINSVYLHRSELALTAQERLFILRTVLLDDSLTKPGWFWIHEWKLSAQVWLPYFATRDSDALMRQTAVELATRIGFSLKKAKKNGDKPIFRVLKDENEAVRLAGLHYLARHGRAVDLRAVEHLLGDNSKDVRAEAERTARIIRLRADPETELQKAIEHSQPFDEALVNASAEYLAKAKSETLVKSLTHLSAALRAFSARELLRRGPISTELMQQMRADEAKAVKECGYLALAKFGRPLQDFVVRKKPFTLPEALKTVLGSETSDPPIDIADVGTALFTSPFSYSLDDPAWNKTNPEVVIAAMLDRMPPETLWDCVQAFQSESPLALKTLGRRHFNENAETIRQLLIGDFKHEADDAEKPEPSTQSFPPAAYFGFSGLVNQDPIESTRGKMRVAALEVLAESPSPTDRELFLRFIDPSDAAQTLPCLLGLASVGQAEDCERMRDLTSSEQPSIAGAATRTYLALSPNPIVAAKEVLSEPSEVKLRVVIAVMLTRKEKRIWPVLQPLLAHDNEEIRRMVCYYAVQMLGRKQLQSLLVEYLARGHYFYNVVVHIDRALYAPPSLRSYFRSEERDHFQK